MCEGFADTPQLGDMNSGVGVRWGVEGHCPRRGKLPPGWETFQFPSGSLGDFHKAYYQVIPDSRPNAIHDFALKEHRFSN